MRSKSIVSAVLISLTLAGCGQSTPWKRSESTDVVTSGPLPPPPTDTPSPIDATDPGSTDPTHINKATLVNVPQLIQSINANRWHDRNAHCQNMTIAIFDNGFYGLEESKGIRLPPDLVVEKAPANEPAVTPHGTKLAEVIWALCTGSRVYSPTRPGPTLKLFNTNGYTNLTAAADAVTKMSKVDVVLYSQVWEFGGNFDGRGFINALVNTVTSRGILWVNAAGNFGQASWQGNVLFQADNEVKLPYQNRYIRVQVSQDQTPVKVTLAWNDFTDLKTYRTKQDLDLILEDANHKEIAAGRLIQDGIDHTSDAKYSAYAREQVTTVLGKGTYYLRVVSTNPSRFSSVSRIRIAADGSGVTFVDQTPDASIMVPADNAEVLTIGASDVGFSSVGRVVGSNLRKPDALSPSVLTFDNGETFAGSSSAAAVAVATVAIYESACGSLSQSVWKSMLSQGAFQAVGMQNPVSKAAPQLALPGLGQCLPSSTSPQATGH